MGSIVARKRKDGSTGYTAQIRIIRDGELAYQEARTFDRRPAAAAWMKKREVQLAEPGAIEALKKHDPSLADVIDRYIAEYAVARKLGKTKQATLRNMARRAIGAMKVSEITSADIVDYGRARIAEDGVSPATVALDMAHLSAIYSIANAAWGFPMDYEEMRKAKVVMRKLGLIARTKERTRRPALEELDELMRHFFDALKRRPYNLPMPKIVAFAIFSTRRMDEITRIRWSDLDEKEQVVIVRDMKNPGQKWGNDVPCYLPDEAMKIIRSMPRTHAEIFPYDVRAIGASYQRACKFLEIEDLTFHDLRHEGISRLFEMAWDIPRVAHVSGHRDWNSLRRYTHLRGKGDKYAGWKWLEKVVALKACTERHPYSRKRNPVKAAA